MSDAVDDLLAQQLGRDPAGHAARAAVSPKIALRDVTDVGGGEAAEMSVDPPRSREAVGGDFIFIGGRR